jgi:hypothetical protein
MTDPDCLVRAGIIERRPAGWAGLDAVERNEELPLVESQRQWLLRILLDSTLRRGPGMLERVVCIPARG